MFTPKEVARLSSPMLFDSNISKQLMNFKARIMTCFTQAEAAICCVIGAEQSVQQRVILSQLSLTLDVLTASWRAQITSDSTQGTVKP